MEFRFEPGAGAGPGWAALEERFHALGRRAAVVGPHGSGKTTLVEQWAARWREAGWEMRMVRLTEEAPRLTSVEWGRLVGGLNAGHRLIVDGAEQWPWWVWRRFIRASRAADGVLITSHRPGRWPTLYQCRTSPALLQALVSELAGPAAAALTDTRPGLFERHRGNVREALRELYDVCAQAG